MTKSNQKNCRLSIEPLEDRRVLATFIVTSIADAGPGSLRQAIADSNVLEGADIIQFDAAIQGAQISLTSGTLDVSDSLTIDASAGARVTINGNNSFRIFSIDDSTPFNKSVVFDNLQIQNGDAYSTDVIDPDVGRGGGILTFENFELRNSVVTGNRANLGGGLAVSAREYSTGADFNGDGEFDCLDINALTSAIATGTNPSAYDLNGDGFVDLADRDMWLSDAAAANGLGSPYKLGDANLDGTVDGQDFIIWNDHRFSNNSEWCSGDFTADGIIDGLDFLVWNDNRFTSSNDMSGGSTITKDLPPGQRGLGNVASVRILNSAVSSNTAMALGPMRSGIPDGSGGGVHLSSVNDVLVSDSLFSDNSASYVGGGLYSDNVKRIDVAESGFTGNHAAGGGGLWSVASETNDAEIHLTGVTITGNTFGGARIADATSFLTNTTISDNTLGGQSGLSILRLSSTAPISGFISDSTISGNTGQGFGGGATFYRVDANVENTIIENNVGFSGAGVWNRFSTLTIRDSMVRVNSASSTGGGIFNSAATLYLYSTHFEGNSSDDGGAIDALNSATHIDGSTFVGNSSADDGGAIRGGRGVLTVSDTVFESNYAQREGGAVSLSSTFADAVTTFENASFIDNEARRGGAIYSQQEGQFSISNSSFSGNRAKSTSTPGGTPNGGALFLTENGVISNSTFAGNNSPNAGGAIFVSFEASDEGKEVSIVQSTLSGNTATNFGGAVYVRQSSGPGNQNPNVVQIEKSTISMNSVVVRGGGVSAGIPSATSSASSLQVQIVNSIVGGNFSSAGANDFFDGDLFDTSPRQTIFAAYSLIGTNTDTAFSESNPDADANIVGGPIGGVVDPLLGALDDYGGSTLTHALLPGSPAIDAGDPMETVSDFDQRGAPFDRIVNGRIDMGAFELQNSTIGEPSLSPSVAAFDMERVNDQEELPGFNLIAAIFAEWDS